MATALKSGRYIIGGKVASCLIRDDEVQATFEDGRVTYFFLETFLRWDPQPVTDTSAPFFWDVT